MNNPRQGKVLKDLTGQRFKSLTVVGLSHFDGDRSYWLAVCDCGTEIVALIQNLKQSRTGSCGCKRKKAESAFNSVFSGYKIHARTRGLSFELSKEEFLILTQKPCYYCAKEKTNLMKRPSGVQFLYNGVDRPDNSKGYNNLNAVSCCGTCNRMKNNLSVEEFLGHAAAIADHTRRCL